MVPTAQKMEEWKINKSLGTNYRASHPAEKHNFEKKNTDSEKLRSSLNTAAMKILNVEL